MGCYLCLQTKDGKDHPDWDWGLAGNHYWAQLYSLLSCEVESESAKTDERLIRPADFDAWRGAIRAAGLPNRDEHLRLMDLMEADPQWWIYVSW